MIFRWKSTKLLSLYAYRTMKWISYSSLLSNYKETTFFWLVLILFHRWPFVVAFFADWKLTWLRNKCTLSPRTLKKESFFFFHFVRFFFIYISNFSLYLSFIIKKWVRLGKSSWIKPWNINFLSRINEQSWEKSMLSFICISSSIAE